MALSTENREIRATRHTTPRDPLSIAQQNTWGSYAAYLQTPHWRTVRGEALRLAGWACSRCGQRRNPQVHHRTYERVGREWQSDLEVLCRGCHEGEHRAQDQRQHTGIYIKLVSDTLRAGHYESFADLIDAVKDACVAGGIAYNPDAVWGAVSALDAKRHGVLDAPPRPEMPALDARDDRPCGHAEALAVLKRLNIKVGLRDMPRAATMDPDAVNRFRQECGLWQR